MKKVILLNSGGLDSACLAKWLKDQEFYIISVFVDLHADNTDLARKAAKKTFKRWCNEWHEISIDIGMKPNYLLPNGQPSGCPFTSNLMTISAMAYGRLRGIHEIYAAFKTDVIPDPDEFVKKTYSLLGQAKLVTWIPSLILPFKDLKRYPAVLERAGLTYKDVSYTHSCNAGLCGKCHKCNERRSLEKAT